MQLGDFLECVRQGQIPPESPDGLTANIYDINHYTARDECIKHGMWAIVAKDWVKILAEWIGNRKVLEIMAGPGWLTKALLEEGVRITPTDNDSWASKHSKAPFLIPVIQMDCVEAICQYPEAEVLLVSWPPYGEEAICRACETWGEDRPIVYIGEGYGGCNAPEEFFDHFQEIELQPRIPLTSWRGIHDNIYVGYYRKREKEE